MIPSLRAEQILSKKKALGTSKKVAQALGISESTVSLYLKLAKLSKKEQKLFDEGERILSSLRSKRPSIKRLTDNNHESVIHEAGRIRFFTEKQMAFYIECNEEHCHKLLKHCMSLKLIERGHGQKYYTLTSRGWGFVDGSKPKHFMSASSIHQQLMRNNIEIEMREKNNTAVFIKTKDALERGIYPAIGEHGVTFKHENKVCLALVLIDDYRMSMSRMLKSLQRYHDKDKKVTSGDRIIRWSDVIDYFFVYTTTNEQRENMVRYVAKRKKDFKVIPRIRIVNPLWEVC